MTDAEIEELLERPDTAEEREALEKLDRDPDRLLEKARERAGDGAIKPK